MTFTYENVYINNYGVVGGPYEKEGPLGLKMDKVYKDLYDGEKTWEQAEVKMQSDSIEMVLRKSKKNKEDINLLISGDLLNQVSASSYTAYEFNIPFFGIYSACSTSVEGIILMSSLIDGGKINVLTEKELDDIKGLTSFTIENIRKDCNKPKVIRLVDKKIALGELK